MPLNRDPSWVTNKANEMKEDDGSNVESSQEPAVMGSEEEHMANDQGPNMRSWKDGLKNYCLYWHI
jgi:hypothetical protein